MGYCYYSNLEVDDGELTAEHVIPRAIGGATQNNGLLLSNVSKRANTVLGVFVDRPFVRSYVVQTARFANALRYADITRPSTIKCMHVGTSEALASDGHVCDLWLDPAMGYVYHFHHPYPTNPEIPYYSGFPIHLHKQQPDPGFCFWVVGATNPAWHQPLYTALGEEFRTTAIYPINAAEGTTAPTVPSNLLALRNRVLSEHNPQSFMKLTTILSLTFADRWLAKTALGVGCVLMGERFAKSTDAILLRKFMLERNPSSREKILLHGSGFLSSPQLPGLAVRDCHTLCLIDAGSLVLHVCLYGRLHASVRVAEDRDLWKGVLGKRGVFFLIAPGIGEGIGPKPLEALVGHNCVPSVPDIDISEILTKCDDKPAPPPAQL